MSPARQLNGDGIKDITDADEAGLVVDSYLEPSDLERAMYNDVKKGLSAPSKVVSCFWKYDDHGSKLFDELTRWPDYYQFRCEREILRREAQNIAEKTGADSIVELGSGTSEKSRVLLKAFSATGGLKYYMPFDVSESMLRSASEGVRKDFPNIKIHGVVGDFHSHLSKVPVEGRRMFVFLGGTIGNMRKPERAIFFAKLRKMMRPEDSLLLGTDIAKDAARHIACYDNSLASELNLNLLKVINSNLEGDFDIGNFRHAVEWDDERQEIVYKIRSQTKQSVNIRKVGLSISFEEGEDIESMVSAKFQEAGVISELTEAGFVFDSWWTDEGGAFGLSLAFAR